MSDVLFPKADRRGPTANQSAGLGSLISVTVAFTFFFPRLDTNKLGAFITETAGRAINVLLRRWYVYTKTLMAH